MIKTEDGTLRKKKKTTEGHY